jgi:protein O-mannosyl-transferase
LLIRNVTLPVFLTNSHALIKHSDIDRKENPTRYPAEQFEIRNVTFCAILIVITTLAYFQIFGSDFIVAFDDELYVTLNDQVKKGLTDETFQWAFSSFTAGNWTPLTMLSHMLDVQLYGLNPLGHHATSLIIHIINSLLMFVLFVQATGEKEKSFLVAALFALHPLHVESVAWVAERKDVLSTLFGLLAIIAYIRYSSSGKMLHYVAMFFCYCFSLLAKPMLVTLPFALLLLDYWPLRRFKSDMAVCTSRLVLEKIPLLILAIAISWVTVIAQRSQDYLVSIDRNPFSISIPIALNAYLTYLRKTFWPNDLAIFYPYEPVPWINALLPLFIIGSVTLAVWMVRRKRPYLPVGWFFFLGTLVPVIGFVRVGMQSYADRYTYLPLTGIFVMLVWGTADLLQSSISRRVVSFTAIAVCMILTYYQSSKWKDGETIYLHAINVTANNWLAHNNLGIIRAKQGKFREALSHQLLAVSIAPGYPDGHYNAAVNYYRLNMPNEAVIQFRRAITLRPDYPYSYIALSRTLSSLNRTQEALEVIEEGLKCLPGNSLLLSDRGMLMQQWKLKSLPNSN